MRIVVIGAGVIGAASAYQLAQRDHEVTVLDAGRSGQGASFGNAGWICPADSGPVAAPGMVMQGLRWMLKADSPLFIRPRPSLPFARFLLQMAAKCNANDFRAGLQANIGLFGESINLFDDWKRDGIDFEMYDDGLLVAFLGKQKFEHHLHDLDIVRDAGLEPRALVGDEVRAEEPALTEQVYGGILFPRERALRSELLTPALVARSRKLGVQFREQCAFEGVLRDGDRVTAVRTVEGPIECDAVVVAAGVWSAAVARKFDVRLAIEPGKGYSIEYGRAPVTLRHNTSFAEHKVVGTPLGSALRLAGTMEFTGYDASVNPLRAEAIRRGPAGFIRDWSSPAPDAEAWAGFRPMTPDSLSMIGRLGKHRNAFVASGHGMFGVTLAPATALAVVEMVESGRVPERLQPFDPARF